MKKTAWYSDWEDNFFLIVQSELENLIKDDKKKTKQARKIKLFVKHAMRLIVSNRYAPATVIIQKHLQTTINELGALENYADNFLTLPQKINRKNKRHVKIHKFKKNKSGPKPWPIKISKHVILGYILAKGCRNAIQLLDQLMKPNGTFDKWLAEKKFASLISTSQLNRNEDLPTQWMNEHKKILINSYLSQVHADRPEIVNKQKKKLIDEIENDAGNIHAYYEKI